MLFLLALPTHQNSSWVQYDVRASMFPSALSLHRPAQHLWCNTPSSPLNYDAASETIITITHINRLKVEKLDSIRRHWGGTHWQCVYHPPRWLVNVSLFRHKHGYKNTWQVTVLGVLRFPAWDDGSLIPTDSWAVRFHLSCRLCFWYRSSSGVNPLMCPPDLDLPPLQAP